MQIVDKSYFQKQNFLNIPLSADVPSGSITPSNSDYLDFLCVKIEKEILLNALGLALWNEKEALTDVTIEEVSNVRWKNLIEGEEYDGKVWEGLKYDYSLLAYRVFEEFTTDTNIRLSAVGAQVPNPENSIRSTPAYLIATANQSFIKQYQGCQEPYIDDIFIDWYENSIEKSLYGYLIDKKDLFPEWDIDKFRFYDSKNSFGI